MWKNCTKRISGATTVLTTRCLTVRDQAPGGDEFKSSDDLGSTLARDLPPREVLFVAFVGAHLSHCNTLRGLRQSCGSTDTWCRVPVVVDKPKGIYLFSTSTITGIDSNPRVYRVVSFKFNEPTKKVETSAFFISPYLSFTSFNLFFNNHKGLNS